MAHHVAIPLQLSSFHGCQQCLLWTNKTLDGGMHILVGFVFHVRDAEQFSQALVLKCLDASLCISEKGPSFASVEKDGHHKRLVQLVLDGEGYVVCSPQLGEAGHG